MKRFRPGPRAHGSALLFLAFVTFFTPLRASADNPFDAMQEELVEDVRRNRRSPQAILPLLQFQRNYDSVAPEVNARLLETLSSDRRLNPWLQSIVGRLHAQHLLRQGQFEASQEAIHTLGYVTDWRVIGPFDNEGKTGFEQAYPPEEQRMQAPVSEASYQGREHMVQWRGYPNTHVNGYVDFDALFRPRANVCGYAETLVQSERAQALTLLFGGGGASRIWWNGEVVHEDPSYRRPYPHRSIAIVGAHRGANRLLVKTCVTDGQWGFFLRIGDARAGIARGIEISADLTPEAVADIEEGHGLRRLPNAPTAPLDAFQSAADGDSPSAQALEDFARFLVYTNADDPAEEHARQAALRAVEVEPTVERLMLAAALVTHRGEAMVFSAQAQELAPNDPNTQLFVARMVSQGPSPEDALPYLQNLPSGTTQWMRGRILESELLNGLGLVESGRARLEEAAALAPNAPAWVGARASAAGATERRDEVVRLRRALLDVRWDDLGARRILLDDALQRGDRDQALEMLRVYRQLASHRSRTYRMAAEIHEALGQPDQALSVLTEGMALAPREPSLHVAQGRLLLRMGQNDAASEALEAALALRPQDTSTRELLEQLEPQERRDESFAVGVAQLLERTQDDDGYPITVLQDLTVNTVFESGLGSTYRQIAVQIHNTEGARRWSRYSVQFDPDVQRIDIRQSRVLRRGEQLSATRSYEQGLGDPRVRIYYNTRARILVFPDLEPGDIVEVQYRIDDVAPRNLFHDYYGDLHYLQQSSPIVQMDYILMTPEDRQFYFNEPNLEGLTHVETVENGQRINHFRVADVPALLPEPDMPGMTEIAPYVHVSTYRTWEDVGRWYWGLIQDQLYADTSLQSVVRELVADAPDLRSKVQRIYDWVIRNTRYVALEFGIHGFLPYRVPDIVSRGFGDCKDKASLIYTMLREAGIDARIVLIRTRRNGQIHDLPASLAVFDHAIAYVPELDLYLDGTAEFSGIEDFPQMDQGVTVLRVGPDDVTLTQSPVTEATNNRRTREMTFQLDADGSGTVRYEEEVRGVEAPGFRSRFQAEGLREDRLEQQMRGLFPGLTISEFEFEHLNDFNRPVELRFEADAPQLGLRDGRNLRIKPTVLSNLTRALATAPDRRLPLDLGLHSAYEERRTVRLPRGYSVSALPESQNVASPFGTLSMQVTQEGNAVIIHTEMSLVQDRVSVEDYPAFRQWTESVDRVLQQRLILTPGSTQ